MDGGDLALFVHYMDPHFGYNPPAPFHTMFTDPHTGETAGLRLRPPDAEERPGDVEQVKALYDGEVAFTDRQIGLLLEAIEKQAPGDEIVVVYSADHGDEFLDHGTGATAAISTRSWSTCPSRSAPRLPAPGG